MSELVVLGIFTVLGSGAFAAIVGGMFGRRKISAEATEIVTRAAGEQLGRMQGEVSRLEEQVRQLRSDNEDLERRLDKFERREMQHRDLLQTHSAWDWRAANALRRHLSPEAYAAEDLDPAPPLYPPS